MNVLSLTLLIWTNKLSKVLLWEYKSIDELGIEWFEIWVYEFKENMTFYLGRSLARFLNIPIGMCHPDDLSSGLMACKSVVRDKPFVTSYL